MTAKQLSEIKRQIRISGYQRIRAEKGLPEPSAHDRRLRRLRNERYRAKQRNKVQEKAS